MLPFFDLIRNIGFIRQLLILIKGGYLMKRSALMVILTAFIATTFLVACGDQKEAEKFQKKVTSADVKKEAKEAMETTKAYTLQQKEEYQKQIKAKLEEIDREIQALQAKAQSRATELKEESKAELNQAMEGLLKKKQAAAEKLNELKSASGKAWEDIKSGVDKAMDDLNKAYDQARSNFGS
ncbi:MAG: hypothetical protein ACWGNO_14700 [Desulfobacterales bacterium]